VPIQVQVQLAEGMTLIESDPEPTSQSDSTLEYRLGLTTDQVLSVLFEAERVTR
jgi:hypothetical protein